MIASNEREPFSLLARSLITRRYPAHSRLTDQSGGRISRLMPVGGWEISAKLLFFNRLESTGWKEMHVISRFFPELQSGAPVRRNATPTQLAKITYLIDA